MTPKQLIEQIQDDRVSGATELALVALAGVREITVAYDGEDPGELITPMLALLRSLQYCRPSMAALQNLLARAQGCIESSNTANVKDAKASIINCCDEASRFAQDAQGAAVDNMAAKISTDDVIMTHSISSTIKRLAERLAGEKPGVRFIVTESRPGDEGKLLARFLAALGLGTTYITEAQADLAMAEVSMVIVGADAVLADGSAINKSGSTLLALSARHHGVAFYVCAEEFKQKADNEYELEQMDTAELGFDSPGVELRNVYFERIPAELITEWVH